MSTKLDNASIKLLLSNSLFRWARMVVSIFLSIYVWKETGDMRLVALFNIVLLVAHWFGAFMTAFFVKAGHRNTMSTIAYIWNIVLYMCLIFYKNELIDHLLLLGAGIWFMAGMYYMTYSVSQFDLSHFKNRWNLEWTKKAMNIINKMFYPLLFWFLVSTYSISYAFFVGILFFVWWLILWIVKLPKRNGSLRLRKFIWMIFSNKKVFFSLLWSFFLTMSFSATIIDFLVSMLLFFETGTEIKMGASLSMISLLSIIIVYCFGKFVKYKNYNIWLVIFLCLYICALFLLLHVESHVSLLLVSSFLVAIIMLYQVIASTTTTNSIHSLEDRDQYKVEFYLVRETMFIGGWILGFLIIYFAWSLSWDGLKWVLYTMMWLASIATALYMRVNIHELDNN